MPDHSWYYMDLPDEPLPMDQALNYFNTRFVEVTQSREILDYATGDRMSYKDFHAIFTSQRHYIGNKLVDATKAWLRSPHHSSVFRYTYEPGKGKLVDDMVNLWRDISPKPIEGNIQPWIDLENHLFKDLNEEQKHWARCWMAYPFQHPGVKLHTAMLLYSPIQGVGKGLLTETLKALYGRHTTDDFSNAHTINNSQLKSTYNPWIARKQLVICDEILVPTSEREVVGERLKSLITEHDVTVNQKYAREITLPNHANFIITSNSPAAVKIEDGDRRYFVVSCSSERISFEQRRAFLQWRDRELNDMNAYQGLLPGLNTLMHHMLTFPLGNFDPFAPAPMTEGKSEVIANTAAPHEIWIRDLLQDLSGHPDLIRTDDLYKSYQQQNHDRETTKQTFAMTLTKLGVLPASKNALTLSCGRHRLRILRNTERYQHMPDSLLAQAYEQQHPHQAGVGWNDIDLSVL